MPLTNCGNAPAACGLMGVRLRRGTGEDKLSLMDALETAQLGGELLQLARRAAQHDDLHAVVVIQMHVKRRHDAVWMFVLNLQQLLR